MLKILPGLQAVLSSLVTSATTPSVSLPSSLTFTSPPKPPQTKQFTVEVVSGSTESVNLLSLSQFVKTSDNFSVPIDSYLVRRLTEEESGMLQQLMQIYEMSFTNDLEPLVHIKQVRVTSLSD